MRISTPFIVVLVLVYVGFRIRYGMCLRSQGRLSPWIIGLWILMALGIATLLFWSPKPPARPPQLPPANSASPGG